MRLHAHTGRQTGRQTCPIRMEKPRKREGVEKTEYARDDGVATKANSHHGQWKAPADEYGAHGREARTRQHLQPCPEEITPAPEERDIVGRWRATRTSTSILTVINKSRGATSNFAYWQKLPQAEKALSDIPHSTAAPASISRQVAKTSTA